MNYVTEVVAYLRAHDVAAFEAPEGVEVAPQVPRFNIVSRPIPFSVENEALGLMQVSKCALEYCRNLLKHVDVVQAVVTHGTGGLDACGRCVYISIGLWGEAGGSIFMIGREGVEIIQVEAHPVTPA